MKLVKEMAKEFLKAMVLILVLPFWVFLFKTVEAMLGASFEKYGLNSVMLVVGLMFIAGTILYGIINDPPKTR